MPEAKNNRTVLSVSALNRSAKGVLESQFSSVWVEGEISNFSRPSSGHWYLTLKDARGQVRCAMFRTRNMRTGFTPQDGDQVVVRGKLSIYEGRGDYQLLLEHMEHAGEGALLRAFDKLKQRLSDAGLFAQDIKKPIPQLPKHIAVITSPTGAAIRDVLRVLERRFPATKVCIVPVPVQGTEAASKIAKAISWCNKQSNANNEFDFDTILITRGGGSLEDLWPFNEEVVAHAIFDSKLPLVSAVGHEIDFTIADFCADLRAPTPSAAAELLSPDQDEYRDLIQGYEQLLQQHLGHQISLLRQLLNTHRSRLKHPGQRLQEHAQRLDELELRLKRATDNKIYKQKAQLSASQNKLSGQSPQQKIDLARNRLSYCNTNLIKDITNLIKSKTLQLQKNAQTLQIASPLATVARGYSIIQKHDDTTVIKNSKQVKLGDKLDIRLAKGELQCEVIERS